MKKLELKPIFKIDVKDEGMYFMVKWDGLKLDALSEHIRVTRKENDYKLQKTQVTHIIKLTNEDYETLTNNFMSDCKMIDGLGGATFEENDKTRELLKKDFDELSEKEFEILRPYLIQEAVMIISSNREDIFINPQGYGYARYVGLK